MLESAIYLNTHTWTKRKRKKNTCLVVGYNPAQTNSSHILKLVKQHFLNAQLIGGI